MESPTDKSRKVLLVDDDPTLVEMYSERLKASGFEVVTAGDGEAGLAAAKTGNPDIVLLDVMMPKMNGVEVAKAIRATKELAATPIIFLTALLQQTEKDDIMKAENVHYCVKSEMTPGDLVVKIDSILAGKDVPQASV